MKFQHETLIGFQVTEQTHNGKIMTFRFKATKLQKYAIQSHKSCVLQVVNNREAILIGCQVTEGIPLVDYIAKSAIFHTKGP